MAFLPSESKAMSLALQLAQKGRYCTQPNPMVGCVITDAKDQVIASGYHKRYGGAHAEINALKSLKEITPPPQPSRLKIFTTLEPCCFSGKTPPCIDAIISSGIKTIIVAMIDPNPKVSGKGIARLKQVGINVGVGLLAAEAQQLNLPFIKSMQTKMPFVRCKIAMSLDGKIAMANGNSKWITSTASRADAQKLRAEADAILTGSGTVLVDNPHLTARHPDCSRAPIRIVLDTNNRIKKNANIFSNEAKTWIYSKDNSILKNNKIALKPLLKELYNKQIYHILLEAGSNLVSSFLSEQLIDELIIYTAPLLLGTDTKEVVNLKINNLDEALKLNITSVQQIGNDVKISAQLV